MAQSAAQFFQNETAKQTRELDVPEASWSDGVNRGASNTCGIGIASANGECKLEDWTLLDQHGDARTPQMSQHIGGGGLGGGDRESYQINAQNAGDDNSEAFALNTVAEGWEVVAVTP
jgi:hypothetical protein